MKVYISADIEGVTGIAHWDETTRSKSEYQEFRRQMTREVAAACEGAIQAGAEAFLIKDAHGSGRNLIADELPECARLVRGWSGHPFCMVQELDETFDAALFVGYHSRAGAETNPMAHTLSLRILHIKINGRYVSEYLMHAYAAALVGVPVVFVSGDAGLCAEVACVSPNTEVVAVSEGIGASTVSRSPTRTVREIEEAVARALGGEPSRCLMRLPRRLHLEIEYRDPAAAYRASFYPGISRRDERTLTFESGDYFEVLRMLLYTVRSTG